MTQPSIPVLALWLETDKVVSTQQKDLTDLTVFVSSCFMKMFWTFCGCIFRKVPQQRPPMSHFHVRHCMVVGFDRQGTFAWSFNRPNDLMSCMSGGFPGWSPRLQMHQCLPTLHPCLSCICRHSLVHLQAEHLSQNWFSIVLSVNNSGNLGNLDRWSIANSQRDFCGFTCNSLRAL